MVQEFYQARVNCITQFTSHVAPLSVEKACSQRAERWRAGERANAIAEAPAHRQGDRVAGRAVVVGIAERGAPGEVAAHARRHSMNHVSFQVRPPSRETP